MTFQTLELDRRLLRAVERAGYTLPTDIQQRAIPVVLAGRDLIASAQTGTGKTAAFALPAIHRLLQPAAREGKGPRVLVLVPTRELALQVLAAFRTYGSFTKLRSFAVLGGESIHKQSQEIGRRHDILVATPGRLIDHLEAGRVSLERVELFVLDEADRMLDMGFIDSVRKIGRAVPQERQTLLFSATLEGEVETIARQLLNNPARIVVAGVQVPHANILQQAIPADDRKHKTALLLALLHNPDIHQAIVFSATRHGAVRLARELEKAGVACAALHGQMRQSARKRTISDLRTGRTRVLVATDVAARGLDIRSVSHVINYELPMVPEDYVHRIGRTGRVDAKGTAISLIGPRDVGLLKAIEKFTGHRIERTKLPGLEAQSPEVAHVAQPPRTHAGRKDAAVRSSNSDRPPTKKPGPPDSRQRFGKAKHYAQKTAEQRAASQATEADFDETSSRPGPTKHQGGQGSPAHQPGGPHRNLDTGIDWRARKKQGKAKKVRYRPLAGVKSAGGGGFSGGKKKHGGKPGRGAGRPK